MITTLLIHSPFLLPSFLGVEGKRITKVVVKKNNAFSTQHKRVLKKINKMFETLLLLMVAEF